MISISVSNSDWLKPSVSAAKEAMRKAASRHGMLMQKLIRAGTGYDSQPSPPNKPSTLRRKAQKGQPLIPGYATGELSTANKWKVTEQGNYFIVSVPDKRQQATEHLEQKGFKIVGIPNDTLAIIATLYVTEFNRGHK